MQCARKFWNRNRIDARLGVRQRGFTVHGLVNRLFVWETAKNQNRRSTWVDKFINLSRGVNF